MNGPLIGTLRDASLFLRATATVVILAFGGLITAPAAAALRTAPLDPTPEAAEPTADQRLADTLQAIRGRLDQAARADQRRGRHEPVALTPLADTLRELDGPITERFDEIQRLIHAKGLGPTIQQRLDAARGHYRRHLEATLEDLDAVERAKTSGERGERVRAAKARLDALKSGPARQPFDPNQLPFKAQEPKRDNLPRESRNQFIQAGLYGNPLPKLAAVGNVLDAYIFDKLPGASDPAYLAETDEIVLTEAIRAKAEELEYNPVKIYFWVRNNVEWLPTWGATQDAELTLCARRGNAMDIASLTLALLRASGIPARYVHGTMDVPVDKYRNWMGGFSDIMAAADYASSGGIPTRVLSEGGQPAWVRMEHIWIQAALDFHPGRAYRNLEADSWINLDPSFKQYEYLEGIDVAQVAGIDGQALADGFLASGTVNDAEGWIQGLDATLLTNAQTTAQQALQNHLETNLPNATVGEVIGGRRIITREYETIPSSIQNPMVAKGATYGALPAALQHQVSLGFGNDGLGNAAQKVDYPFTRLNNRKVTISFAPSTPEDEAALLALLPEGEITDISQLPDTIPAYLISVTPELKVDGEVVLQGTPMQLGEDLDFVYTLTNPIYGTLSYPGKVVAGSYLSVAVIGGSVAPGKLAELKAKLENTQGILTTQDQAQLAALGREDILGDMFYAGTLGYFAESQGLAHVMTLQQKAHMQQLPSGGTYGYVPEVDYFWGLPNGIRSGGVVMDLDALNITAQTDDGTNKFNLVFQLGALSSALEHAIPEQMFVTAENPGEAVSAVKALAKAQQQGQRIYHITEANLATALADIRQDAGTVQEIRDAVATGKEVITHTDSIGVPGWSGAGYVVFDPVKGDGAWRIGGGMNGTFLVDIVGFLFAGLTGALDGFGDNVSSGPSGANTRQINLASKLAAASALLGILTFVLSSVGTLTNDNLSWHQKLGQISSWIFGAAAASKVGAAFAVGVLSPMSALLVVAAFSIFMSVIMIEFASIYYASRSMKRNLA